MGGGIGGLRWFWGAGGATEGLGGTDCTPELPERPRLPRLSLESAALFPPQVVRGARPTLPPPSVGARGRGRGGWAVPWVRGRGGGARRGGKWRDLWGLEICGPQRGGGVGASQHKVAPDMGRALEGGKEGLGGVGGVPNGAGAKGEVSWKMSWASPGEIMKWVRERDR